MVTSLRDTLGGGYLAITVIEDGRERPTASELDELDNAVVNRFGWAFRFGMGASSSLNDFRYGYIVGGKELTLNPETIGKFEEKLEQETQLSNPAVLMRPVTVPDEEFERMEKLGRFPSEVLAALDGLKDDVRDRK